MLSSNSSGTTFAIGLAVFGLGLVVSGIRRYRRSSKETSLLQLTSQIDTGADSKSQTPEVDPVGPPESNKNVPSNTAQPNLPLVYFGLVFTLALPVWLYGEKPLPVPVKLPVSALGAVIPLFAACILTYQQQGFNGIRSLFQKVLDYRKIKSKIWYLPTLFLYPFVSVLSYLVMRLAGRPLPDPQIPWLAAPVYLLTFFIFGIGEELGWMGYTFDPMQSRWGALKASLLLGLVWALFHLIPDLQNGRAADWILWQRLSSIAFRVLIAWIYNNTGKSIFAVVLFHATNNLSWALFPDDGSHYDPFLILLFSLPVVGFVILRSDPKTLARVRFAQVME